jgi:hypothetical protein
MCQGGNNGDANHSDEHQTSSERSAHIAPHKA